MARRRQLGSEGGDGAIRPDFGDGGLKPDPMRSLEEQVRGHLEVAASTSSPVIKEKRLAAADAAFEMLMDVQNVPQSTRVDWKNSPGVKAIEAERQKVGLQGVGVLATLDASDPCPTERQVEEMNAPGESVDEPEEMPMDRCARGEHEQMESEPWRCVYSESHVDLNAPDATKLVLVFCPWLVAERSDSHNWVLKQRRKVESGANAGRYGWKDSGYYGTPGQAATKALHLMAESEAGTGGVRFSFLTQTMVMVEEKLRGHVQQAAASEARAAALAEALGVVKGEEDRERIQKLMG